MKVVILCVIISTTFWFFSALNKPDYVTQINYPIKVTYDDSLYVATSELPDRIALEVTGGGWDLMTRSFGFGMEPLIIELEDPLKENYKVAAALRQEIAPLIDPVQITYILADTIKFNIDILGRREIEVALDSTSLSFEPNLRKTSNIELTPSKITVKGAKSVIDTIQSPYFLRLGDEAVGKNVNQNVPLTGMTSELVKTNVDQVNVTFEVTEFLQLSREVELKKLNFNGRAVSINPTNVKVYYEWNSKLSQQADSIAFDLIVDFRKLQKNDSTILIEFRPKSALIINPRISPSKVKVIYE
uniref:hypothetical protein n=1 Tax=Roseivirga sp. TaxID=1964215 RepID=UPI0040575A1B